MTGDADADAFAFDYRPGRLRYGPNCVADLGTDVADAGADRALVVTGRTVGESPAVTDPVEAGLGDRHAGTLAVTTPEKRINTAIAAADRGVETGADAVVGVGGGSSLDLAKAVAVLLGRARSRGRGTDGDAPDRAGTRGSDAGAGDGDRPPGPDDRAAVVREFARSGTLAVADPVPVFAVPTTLAGADLSGVAGLTAAGDAVRAARDGSAGTTDPEAGDGDDSSGGDAGDGGDADSTGGDDTAGDGGDGDDPDAVSGGLSAASLMPAAVHHDPELFRTTPARVLCGSAMNGFDKAVEAVYARQATPVTDATATRALDLLSVGLPKLGAGDRDDRTMRQVLHGVALAQYGVSRPDGLLLSVLHAYGHALRDAGLQQGVGHAVVAPHALRDLFGAVDGRRSLLASGLGVRTAGRTPAEVAEGVVAVVARVRDGLGLPTRLRDVDGPDRAELPAVAEATVADSFLSNGPPEYDPTVADVEAVLERAW